VTFKIFGTSINTIIPPAGLQFNNKHTSAAEGLARTLDALRSLLTLKLFAVPGRVGGWGLQEPKIVNAPKMPTHLNDPYVAHGDAIPIRQFVTL
jgi:hypothetical protein